MSKPVSDPHAESGLDFVSLLKIDKVIEGHTSTNFEKEENHEDKKVSQDELKKRFNLAVKVPKIETDYRTFYSENLSTLHQLYSREAFFVMLAHGYSDKSDAATDLGSNSGTFAKLCSLIHSELTIANY